jgi:glycosyltransferase involved in cell wall biosynthesis
MRVGIVVKECPPTLGGAFSIQKAILKGLAGFEASHELVLLVDGEKFDSQSYPFPISYLDRSVQEDRPANWIESSALTIMRWLPAGRPRNLFHRISLLAHGTEPPVLYDRAIEAAIDLFNLEAIWHLWPESSPASVPTICTVWDLQHRARPYFPEVGGWRWEVRDSKNRSCLPRAYKVIAGTNAGRDEISFYYGVSSENIEVIPFPAYKVDDSGGELGIEAINRRFSFHGEYLFYPANFWAHKNHVNLLLALRELRDTHGFDFKLVLSGGDAGALSYIERKVSELGLSGAVVFVGFVSEMELAALYRNAFCLIYPSFFGPDNLPPLEAFLLECPVVVADIPGSREQLGDAPLYFAPEEPNAIAGAVARLRNDEVLYRESVRRGYERAKAWSAIDYARRMHEILDKLESIVRCWGTVRAPERP